MWWGTWHIMSHTHQPLSCLGWNPGCWSIFWQCVNDLKDLITNWLFPSLQNVRLPYTTLLIYATVKMVDASHLRWQTTMTCSSSTTECPRQAARRSLTSLMICVLRTIFMSCTSIRPKTTLSCPYRIRWEEQVAVSPHLTKNQLKLQRLLLT